MDSCLCNVTTFTFVLCIHQEVLQTVYWYWCMHSKGSVRHHNFCQGRLSFGCLPNKHADLIFCVGACRSRTDIFRYSMCSWTLCAGMAGQISCRYFCRASLQMHAYYSLHFALAAVAADACLPQLAIAFAVVASVLGGLS